MEARGPPVASSSPPGGPASTSASSLASTLGESHVVDNEFWRLMMGVGPIAGVDGAALNKPMRDAMVRAVRAAACRDMCKASVVAFGCNFVPKLLDYKKRANVPTSFCINLTVRYHDRSTYHSVCRRGVLKRLTMLLYL